MLSKPSVITTSFFPNDGIQFHARHHQCNAATFTPPLLHPGWISSPTPWLRDTLWKGTSSALCSQPLPLLLPWISWHSLPNLPSYCSAQFFSTFMKIRAAAQTSARLGRGNDLSIPLCCFPSFQQLFIHARNLWRLFPVRPLGEALFKCLCEFPEDHITQISLFICLGAPSKGSWRFVSLVLPFHSWTQNFNILKDAFLLLIICFTLWFVMSAPLWSFWSNLKKNRWWTFPQKCLRDSTEIFVSYQQLSYRKYMAGGGSILCSTSERSNQQTNSQVSGALHHLPWPTSESTWFSFPHTGRFGFWNMLTWLIASGRTQRSLNLKQQLWTDWGEKPQATHVCCTQVGQVAPKTSRALASPSVGYQQCRRCQLEFCIHSEGQKSKRTSHSYNSPGETCSGIPMWASWTNRGVDPQKEKMREAGKEYPSVQKTPSKRKGNALFPFRMGRTSNHDRKGKSTGC